MSVYVYVCVFTAEFTSHFAIWRTLGLGTHACKYTHSTLSFFLSSSQVNSVIDASLPLYNEMYEARLALEVAATKV